MGVLITGCLCLSSPVLAGLGSGVSNTAVIDTEPPELSVQQFPEHTLFQGGDLVTFQWTTGDVHPGTLPEHFMAMVMIDGVAHSAFSYFPDVEDHVWEWIAVEASSGDVHLRVEVRDAFGNLTVDTSAEFILLSSVTDVPEFKNELELAGPSPNPFNPSTQLSFHLPVAGAVKLEVFDMRGRRVRTLLEGNREAGDFSVSWDGRNDRGLMQAGGLYLFVLDFRGPGHDDRITRKAVLIP